MSTAIASGRFAAARAFVVGWMRHPLAPWALAAAVLGALGFALLGTTPGRSVREVAPPVPWALEPPAPPATENAQAILASRATWASQPEAVAAEAVERVPLPVLLGVIAGGPAPHALFQMPDGQRVRAASDTRLPDGSEVLEVHPTRVRWKDAGGEERTTQLFDARAL